MKKIQIQVDRRICGGLARLTKGRWRGWRPILLIRDERGITTAVVAVSLLTILLWLAFLIDLGGLLIRREQVTNMAELAAAAGGRQVADAIAYAAGVREPNPTPEQKKHPEGVIKPDDRTAIEDGSYQLPGATVGEAVKSEAKKYALINAPTNMNFNSSDENLYIEYGKDLNNCADDPDQKKIPILVNVRSTYQFFFSNVLKIFHLRESVPISATSTYQILICP